MQELVNLARKFIEELSAPFVSREEEAKVIALALLAKEHAIFIGEPGTAKSALARRAAELLNARFFKYLLTRYTEPSELFGPLDIKALREGKYVRITKGKLPEAEIAFLDEIFNANSAILNALLSILQERILYDGYSEIKVPLWTLIAASNRVPDEPELDALYDRLLLRHYTRPVAEDKWSKLLDAAWAIERGEAPPARPILSLKELEQLHKVVLSVDLSPVREKLLKLYVILEEKGLHLTDRRKGKALKVIAAHAVINGRTSATEEDLMVLKYIAPRDEDDFEKVSVVLAEELKTPMRYMRELSEIHANIREAFNLVEQMPEYDSRLLDMLKTVKVTRERILTLARESGDRSIEQYANEIVEEVDELLEKIAKKLGF